MEAYVKEWNGAITICYPFMAKSATTNIQAKEIEVKRKINAAGFTPNEEQREYFEMDM